ncbi:MAG: ABC transporter substrate-binding protein [Rhodospirillaceae bacterium]|nr:MAG: ABC transporter substrate-binding protein [Rhodospirillaceae bacterium]
MKRFTTAAAASLSLATLANAAPAFAADSVAVASYGGAYQEALHKAFYAPTAKTLGIDIKEFTLSGITDVRTQVKAGAVEWDVVELYAGQCQQAADEGLIEPLDYNVIKTDGVPKQLVQSHWVGFTAYSTVLAWNKDVYKDNPPKNWADFWDVKKFPGTRALSGYGPSTNAEIALMADGVPADKLYPLDMDRAFKKLEEIKPDITVWWNSGAQSGQLAVNQEADMLAIWVARIDAAIKEGAPYDFTYNQGVVDIECLVVPKGAKHKDLAMKVINEFLKPELQADLPKYVPYGPVNQDAYKTGKITPDLLKNANSTPENLAKQVIQDKPYWAKNGQAAQERWDAFLQK